MHSNMISQPVVLLERLRGEPTPRDDPQPSQSPSPEPEPLENHRDNINEHRARSRSPAERPRLRRLRKKKELQRIHPMSLRSRRLSKLELNRIIAESCTPVRKPTSRRSKKTSSDDDEPLILQVSPRNACRSSSSNTQNGTADKSIPNDRTLRLDVSKKRTHKSSSSMERTPKKKTPKKKRSPKQTTSKKSTKQPAKVLPEFTFAVVREDPVILEEPIIKENPDDSVRSESPTDPIILNFADIIGYKESSVNPIIHFMDDPVDPATSDGPAAPTVPDTKDNPVIPPIAHSKVMSPNYSQGVTNSSKTRRQLVLTPEELILENKSENLDDLSEQPDFQEQPVFQEQPDFQEQPRIPEQRHIPEQRRIPEQRQIPEQRHFPEQPDFSNIEFLDDGIPIEEGTQYGVPDNDNDDEDSDNTPPHEIVRMDAGSEVQTPEPMPGPSGMQYQFEVYDPVFGRYKEFPSVTGIRGFAHSNSTYQHILKNTALNLEAEREKLNNRTRNHNHEVQSEIYITEEDQDCITHKWPNFQDVIKAPEKVLAARCRECSRCIRIAKLIKISALLKTTQLNSKSKSNNVAALLTCPLIDNSEVDNAKVNNAVRAASPPKTQRHQYFDLIPKHPTMMIKLGSHMVHGKDLLSVSLAPRTEDRGENRDSSQQDSERLLDRLFDTMSLSLNDNAEDDRISLSSSSNSFAPVPEELEELEEPDEREESQEPERAVAPQELQAPQQPRALQGVRVPQKSQATQVSQEPRQLEEDLSERVEQLRKKEEEAIKRLAQVEKIQESVKSKSESAIAEFEAQNRFGLSQILEVKNNCQTELWRFQEQVLQLHKRNEVDLARLRSEIKANLQAEMEADRRMVKEVDNMAKALEKEKDAKAMSSAESVPDLDAPGTSGCVIPSVGGTLVDAPIYFPSDEEFKDPIAYYEKIWPIANRYGICKVVPPPSWDPPPCAVKDDMRFVVTNQYISRLFSRWGPAARELSAIKLCLRQQNVNFSRPPLLEGVEVNLPKLYHLVQRHGGLENVINKNRWGRVAEDMKFTKLPHTEKRLDQIYVKFLLPYDTLSHQERQEIMRKVEIAWNRKNQKLLDRAMNPLYRQKRMLGLMESSDDETEDEDTAIAVNDTEDCVIKGGSMTLARFQKVAAMAFENTFGPRSEAPPNVMVIEEHYWRTVTLGTEHMCAYAAVIDTGDEGYGFPKNRNEPYGDHPFNPKMISNHPRNVLRYLGSVLGLTVPTLLLGMLFSTSCWHKDPHTLPWLEYQHQGPTRIWYGIARDQADNFRKAVETLCPTSCQNKGLWLPTDISMIPPQVLREHNVSLARLTQEIREFIVAFPNAYTCCITTGYTESESVYFAPPCWLESLWSVFKETRDSCEPTMFAMEHLLYNIGKDKEADIEILKITQPLFDKMLREEVTNRQMLQERGLSFVKDSQTLGKSSKKKKANPFNSQDVDECDYCRAILFLSKVKGITGRDSLFCLEHALKLLETEKYRDAEVAPLTVLVHVSVSELNSINADMKHRLGIRSV